VIAIMSDAPLAASVKQVRPWTDAQLAFWNALKIGGSLLVTWTVALAVRFALPRQLGPELYGVYNFAEAFAASFFVLTTLGIETYVQKEIPVRGDHASDFFGGILAVRVALAFALVLVIALILHLDGRSSEVRHIVYLFAAGQVFFVANATLSALLHARGTVDGLSIVNVLAKLLWGAGMVAAIAMRAELVALAASFAVAEGLKTAFLAWLCRKHVSLRLRIDVKATKAVVAASVPFFVTTLATTLFSKIDDTLIGFLANDREVGWFGLASNLAQLALLLAPLMGSVLLPLFSRVAARSGEELSRVMRRALEVILMIAVPASLALGLGADVWIGIVGGRDYAPAVIALRILSPVFIVTYVGMVCADYLYLSGRSWTVTWVCIGGLAVNAGLNATLIRPLLEAWGPGGAGVGGALATIGTELFTCGMFVWIIGRNVVDRRLLVTGTKLVASCAAAIAVDRACASLGPSRLVLDAGAYLVLAVGTGAVRVREVLEFVAAARRSRRAGAY
jgi:O-antigen/teichoic acid export membrane protein